MYLAIAQPWLQPKAVKRIVVSVATVVTFIIIGVFDYNQFIQPAGEFHNGAFKDFKFHKEDYDISRRVLERIGKESVLLANNEGGAFVGNMGLPSLQLRYYLASNTIGGLYNTAKLEFKKKLRQIKPEYVLVTEWNDELIRLFNPSNSTKMGLFRKISASPPHFAEVSF